MEGLKILVSAVVLALVLAVVALADARVAGENFVSQEDEPSATLSEALEATNSIELTVDSNTGESDVDADVSSSVDVDFSSSVDIDVSGSGSASSDQSGEEGDSTPPPPASIDVDGQVLSCPEGERVEWESDTAEFECRNRNGRINLDFESEGGSIKVHFKYP